MSVQQAVERNAPPPAAQSLLQAMTGYWVSQAVYVAAKLGIADVIADGHVHHEVLAAATHTHAPTLYRVLRALASVGVFSETEHGYFALTPQSALLRTGTPNSLRALAITYNEEQYRTWADLLFCVRTGEQAFAHTFGMEFFDYLARNAEPAQVFHEAMTAWTTQVASAVVSAYDFSAFRTIVDVGGSHGTLLATILRSSPASSGILFDLPDVVVDAAQHLRTAGIADRCACVGGDFFAGVPAGGDAYVLSQILHDWNDDRCTTILERCRHVIPAHGRLLVVELVLPPGPEPFFGKWVDLHMLVMAGGRERTEEEYGTLFRAADFALTRVVPTAAGPSVVEAVPIS